MHERQKKLNHKDTKTRRHRDAEIDRLVYDLYGLTLPGDIRKAAPEARRYIQMTVDHPLDHT